jgi:hypothetical protein
MATAATAVLVLGFVVAVAAGSLPGNSESTPLLDLEVRTELDLTPVFAWVLLAMAVIGAVLMALGVRQTRPRQERNRRRILGSLIALVVFVVVFRWVRPAAEMLLEEGSALTESATDALGEGQARTASGWLFSLLLAAVVAAALTRIGLSINAAPPPLNADEPDVTEGVHEPVAAKRVIRSPGNDPRSRVLEAYQEFETGVEEAGQPRVPTETTGRHARRAGELLELDSGVVDALVTQHATARYASTEPALSDAETAELLSTQLRERIEG